MANNSWLTVQPTSGQGDDTLSNSGTVHQGRLQRQTLVTAIPEGVDSAKSYQVIQEPNDEYLILDETSFEVGQEASTIVISGKSNSPRITIALVSGNNIPIVLPGTYTVNDLSTINGELIPNDPGATAEFLFSVQVPIPRNTVGNRIGRITVTGSIGSVTEIVTVYQATSTWTINYVKGDYIDAINKELEIVNWGNTATAVATLLPNTAQYTYSFLGWYDGNTLVSSSLELSVPNITADRGFIAIGSRALNRYSLSFTFSPNSGGTASNAGTYDYGTDISSLATPAVGYDFTRWRNTATGEIFTSNPLNITVDGNKNFEVVFTIKSYDINLATEYRIEESGNFISGILGGTTTGGGTFTHGESVTVEAIPTTGYRFDGWYEGVIKISDNVSYTFEADNPRNLIARFQRQWFTITFSATGGGTVYPISQRVKFGEEATSTATALTGYSFIEWNNGIKTPQLIVENVTESASYQAVFEINTFTITYEKSTGISSVSPTSEVVEYNSDASGSTAELAEGYDFNGWFDGATRVSFIPTYGPKNVVRDMTLTAQAAIKNFYIEVYVQYRDTDSTGSFADGTNGGEVTGSGSYQYGSRAVLTAIPKPGYTFIGWIEASGAPAGEDLTYIIERVTSPTTIYARFQKNWYTVTYAQGKGIEDLTKESDRVSYNGSVTSPPVYLLVGYNTPTWTKTSGVGNLTVEYNIATLSAIQSDCVLTAFAIIDKNTVIYEKNENIFSIEKTSEVVEYGGTATCEAVLMTNTAQYTYSFDGWFDEASLVSSDLSLVAENITGSIIFTARGRATTNTYTITVNNGSGSGTYDYGTKVTLTGIIPDGHTFTKWSDGVTTISREVTVVGDATYTAEYIINTYTVTYITKSEGILLSRESEAVKWGEDGLGCTVTLSKYYRFAGWYALRPNSVFVSNELTFIPLSVKENLIFEAQAYLPTGRVDAYSVYRDTDGTGGYDTGQSIEASPGGITSGGGGYSYGSTVRLAAAPSIGYKFDGWYSGRNTGSLLSGSLNYEFIIELPLSVYARFTKIYYTITYQRGQYILTQTRDSERVAYMEDALGCTFILPDPTEALVFTIDGWYTNNPGQASMRVTTSTTFQPKGITSDAGYKSSVTSATRSYTVTYNKNAYINSVSRTSESVFYGRMAAGSTASLPATTAQYSYSFDGWYNGSTRVSTLLTYSPGTITGAVTVEARGNRTTRSYAISASLHSSSSGRGSVSGSGSYYYGASAIVICTKNNSGDVFDGWYEGNTRVSTNLSYTFTVTGARNLVARIFYLEVSPSSLSFAGGGGSQTFTIFTNVNWRIT